jgi:Cu-Zn family superoxide dismutase
MRKILFLFFVSACQSPVSLEKKTATKIDVELHSKNGSKAAGILHISELPQNKLEITGTITGLKPQGLHGFHIHEYPNCEDEAALLAGGHFNPNHTHIHGKSVAHHPYENQHAGDLGNIFADKHGVATIHLTITTPPLTLSKDNSPYFILNRSVVIHEQRDDEESQHSGNSGKRILCGVLKK